MAKASTVPNDQPETRIEFVWKVLTPEGTMVPPRCGGRATTLTQLWPSEAEAARGLDQFYKQWRSQPQPWLAHSSEEWATTEGSQHVLVQVYIRDMQPIMVTHRTT